MLNILLELNWGGIQVEGDALAHGICLAFEFQEH